MSPNNPPADPAESTEVVNANPSTSKQQPNSASEPAPESPGKTPQVLDEAVQSPTAQENETQPVSEETVQSVTAQENDTGHVSKDKVPSVTAQENDTERVSEDKVPPFAVQDNEVVNGGNDAVVLSELRSSLHTISSGVQGLANTVQDFFGLSDSSSSASSDEEQFSWAKFKSRARRRRHVRRRREKGAQSSSSSEIIESDDESKKPPRGIRLEIRECNLEQFQSRPAGDSHELSCVDILIAGDSLEKDIEVFRDAVDEMKFGTNEIWKPRHVLDRKENPASEETEKKWIRRIRINSRAVLEILRIIVSDSFVAWNRPIVFSRPFQLLVSLHEKVKEQLTNMKRLASDIFDDRGNSEHLTGIAGSSTTTPAHESDNLIKVLAETPKALDELTCFVDFMETRIMPDSRRYSGPSSSPSETIRYEDLWYLFKPGTLVYSAPEPSSWDRFRSSPHSHRFLRVMETHLGRTSPAKPPIRLAYEGPWNLLLHFIEYDGTSYSPIAFVRSILPFSGRKKVTDLPIYPVTYLEDDQIFSQAQSDGATYVSLIERRSGFYSGWTQIVTPFGVPLIPYTREYTPDSLTASPEHIESDILVDFQETFNAFPGWKLNFYPDITGMLASEISWPQSEPYDLPILEWDEVGRVRIDQTDRFLVVDATERSEAIKFVEEDTLGLFKTETRTTPTGEHLALLPTRFFAYAVLQRKFVQLSTRFVRSADLEANDKAFEKLEINKDYKRLILALVKSHFDKVETEKKTNTEIETQDLIRGKGKGVVILLHGVPGVGKTATAEAVALKWKKPLFPITCGDLGYTADTLEKSLNEIFRLAHHWGCILLLDEADVFITQRERHDLKRNALVSGMCEACTLTV